MKKSLLVAILATLTLAACTSIDYREYSAANNQYIGQGGSFQTVDSMQIWTTGAPERPFKIIGMIDAQIQDGWGADSMMASAVVAEAKKRGGDAVIVDSRDYIQGSTDYSIPVYQPYEGKNAGEAMWHGAAQGAAMANAWMRPRPQKLASYVVIKYLEQ